MKAMTRRALPALALLGAGWMWGGLLPQDLEAQRVPPDRSRLEEQVQERFRDRVAEELGLDDAGSQALWEAVEGFEEERRALVRRQSDLRRRLRGTGALLSDDEALAVLEEFAQVREEEARLLRLEQERLLGVLTPPQLVRFYTLREALAERIRRLRQARPRARGTQGLEGFPSGPVLSGGAEGGPPGGGLRAGAGTVPDRGRTP